MASGTQQVSHSTKEVETINNQRTEGIQVLAASSQQLSATIQEIAANSQSLAQQAEGLRIAVQKFKL